MLRRTKILVTLGPACSDYDTLKAMIQAGVNMIRLNFSHGDYAEHQQRLENVRRASYDLNGHVGILADLQGPKIRIGQFQNGGVELQEGQNFTLNVDLGDSKGDENQVGINYPGLVNDVQADDILLLADGLIELKVISVQDKRIDTQVLVGGELTDAKGINRRGGGLSAATLTEKDERDLQRAVDMGVDFIALSFVRDVEDIHTARTLISHAGGSCGLVAKIERTEALDSLDDIITASDGVMIARGDLALEIGEAEVPGLQKHIINRSRALDRPVITATQMMESMIHASMPTRAEVSDVANAVLDGTDAVMLSAETATGDHPVQVIKAMVRSCVGAEKNPRTRVSGHRVECWFERMDEAIAMAAMYTANHMPIKAIIALTESGATPLWMSRIRSGIPIFGLSRHTRSRGRMTLYRGVYPVPFDVTTVQRSEVNIQALNALKAYQYIQDGDWVLLTKGDYMGVLGGTNAMKIIEVGRTGT